MLFRQVLIHQEDVSRQKTEASMKEVKMTPFIGYSIFSLKDEIFCTISTVLFVMDMDNKADNCAGCIQKDRCGQVYGKLGKAKGPNVIWPVILAFLVPILVFIGCLACADTFLDGRVEGNLLIATTFTIALIPTLAVIFIIRMVRNRFK
jgi:uncharacterized membrane protein (DUF485 family)